MKEQREIIWFECGVCQCRIMRELGFDKHTSQFEKDNIISQEKTQMVIRHQKLHDDADKLKLCRKSWESLKWALDK